MKREVRLHLPLAQGTSFKLHLCNKYAMPLPQEAKAFVLGADGAFTVSLEVNTEETCWSVDVLPRHSLFWVHEGEGVQEVDMSVQQYPPRSLPTFAADKDATLNVVNTMGMALCDTPMTQEEKRLMCRYDAYDEKGDDMLMCEIDNKVGATYAQ